MSKTEKPPARFIIDDFTTQYRNGQIDTPLMALSVKDILKKLADSRPPHIEADFLDSMFQYKLALNEEASYIFNAAIAMIHGRDTPHLYTFLGASAQTTPRDLLIRDADGLKAAYSDLGITEGDTTFAAKLEGLNKVAQKFARSVYPALPREMN